MLGNPRKLKITDVLICLASGVVFGPIFIPLFLIGINQPIFTNMREWKKNGAANKARPQPYDFLIWQCQDPSRDLMGLRASIAGMDYHPRLALTVLRPADLNDLADLCRLEAACFSCDRLSLRSWRHLIRAASTDVAVALVGDRLTGAAVLLRRKGSSVGRIYSLSVDPALRGRGVARHLLDHLTILAHRQGLMRLRLEVRPENTAALQLYLAQGFRPIGVSLAYYEDDGACLHCERSLANFRPASSAVWRKITYEGSHARSPDHRQ